MKKAKPTAKKPFVCHVCERKKFSTKQGLTLHITRYCTVIKDMVK